MAQSDIKEIQEKYIVKYKSLMEYLETHSGKKIRNPMDVSELYLILKTEVSCLFVKLYKIDY